MFYLTGVKKSTESQLEPTKSNGGFISSTQVPNSINNLFATVAKLEEVKTTYKAIAFKNTNPSTITSIQAWFDFDDEQAIVNYELGIVIPAINECGNYVEFINDDSTSPRNITFYPADGFVNKITFPTNITQNGFIVFWIKRTLSPKTITCQINPPIEQGLEFSLTINTLP